MKEATRTSIVSKRWRSLWTNLADLDFDYLQVVPEYREDLCKPTQKQATKYINWVNQVVKLHTGPSIDKFRVRFWFSDSHKHHIDRWVKFALSKRVKNLHLELLSLGRGFVCIYTLGFHILNPSLLDSGIRSLTSLHLMNVDVSGEFLEFLLSGCPLLERLILRHCKQSLVKLKVASDKLKQLIIHGCCNLDEIEIQAVNLSYLEYFGDASIEYKCAPAIIEASFKGYCCTASVPICKQIACFSKHLSKLSLDFSIVELKWDPDTMFELPSEGSPCFSNLKHLVVRFRIELDLFGVARLLEACPVVREIKFELFWNHEDIEEDEIKNEYFGDVKQDDVDSEDMEEDVDSEDTEEDFDSEDMEEYVDSEDTKEDFDSEDMEEDVDSEDIEDDVDSEDIEEDVDGGNIMLELRENQKKYMALPELTVVDVVGFKGCSYDVKLLVHVLKIATQLQTLVCHPITDIFSEDGIQVARSRARKLSTIVSSELNFVIIPNTSLYGGKVFQNPPTI